MNERIKLLAERAGFGPAWFEEAAPGHPALPKEGILKEFANLIVKDAMDQCRQEWYDLNNAPHTGTDPRSIGLRVGMKGGVIKCLSRLSKHFESPTTSNIEAGAEIHSGGGYEVATEEDYLKALAKREGRNE